MSEFEKNESANIISSIVEDKSEPLSASVRNPFWHLLTVCLPLGILSLLYFNGYSLIHKEMSKDNMIYFWVFQGLIFADIMLFAGTACVMKRLKRSWNIPMFIGMFFLQAFLTTELLNIETRICPFSIDYFIFPRMLYTCYIFTFLMPSLTHAVFALSIIADIKNLFNKTLLVLAGIIFPPALIYISGVLLFNNWWFFKWLKSINISSIIIFIVFLSLTGIFLVAVTKLLIMGYQRIRENKKNDIYLIILISAVLPISGLMLNIMIPFPVDLQDWRIYALTILNSFFLILPKFKRHISLRLIVFFGTCVMYSFTVYFFVLFLPYLPLFMPAILACGLGFLILTPTLLFYVHTRRLAEETKELFIIIPKSLIIALISAGVLFIPVIITCIALHDRGVFDKGLKIVYASDYDKRINLSEAQTVISAFERIHGSKYQDKLPYIDLYYKRIALNNMTISDSKLRDVYQKLSGRLLPDNRPGIFSNNRQKVSGNTEKRHGDKFHITKLELKQGLPNNGVCNAKLNISVKNTGPIGNFSRNEIILDISIPEFIFISGSSLKIDNNFVKGHIFEKKSALWIYEKIRAVRKDPSLLYYKAPDKLRLHIFPINLGATRDFEIDFVYPDGFAPSVSCDDNGIAISASIMKMEEAGIMLNDNKFFILKDNSALTELKRKPVICFIVDSTEKSLNILSKSYPACLKEIADKIGIADFSIVSATVNADVLVPEANMGNAAFKFPAVSPQNGGFMCDRVLRSEILRWQKIKDKFPVFVVLSGDSTFNPGQLSPFFSFSQLMPENKKIVFAKAPFDKLETLDISNGTVFPFSSLKFAKVYDAGKEGIIASDEPVIIPQKDIDPKNIYLLALNMKKETDNFYRTPSLEDNLIRKIVASSKSSGIMNPLTSYIVLERDSQWRKLQEVEEQKLNSNSNLDIEEKAPEPELYIFAILLVLLFIAERLFKFLRRKKSRLEN